MSIARKVVERLDQIASFEDSMASVEAVTIIEDTYNPLLSAAYYWLRGGAGGQAMGALLCGHQGPVGAPLCRDCTKKRLKEALE